MKNRYMRFLAPVLALILLCGCVSPAPAPTTAATIPTEAITEPTIPETVPEDGSPDDVTCKGSYTGAVRAGMVVAKTGSGKLSNRQLQAWYWAAAAAYRQSGNEIQPDYTKPLDTQECPIDDSVNSWQQYFLRQALNGWHTARALMELSQEEGLPVEEAFQPNAEEREKYMVDIPATKFMYRQEPGYQPNTMHQAWLDAIPEMLGDMAESLGYADAGALAEDAFGTTQDALTEMIETYNLGYMYFTDRSYYLELTQEEITQWYTEHEADYASQGITADSGKLVTIRHILLLPQETEGLTVEIAEDGAVTCDESLWEACQKEAENLIYKWKTHGRPGFESTFADFAYRYSQDAATSADGGLYNDLPQGQLIPELDEWCFAEGREAKDYTILRTQYGIHILYFSGSTDIWYARSREDLTAHRQLALIQEARERYPMEVTYSSIVLGQGQAQVSGDSLLYADLAHERFPEVPLYLQQDYGKIKYGAYRLRTHGCGLVSMAMLGSYMTDDEHTPAELCGPLGMYCGNSGTDRTMFNYEAPAMGFYIRERTFSDDTAKEALMDGYMVISIQRGGYWTRGGHYIVIEKMFEDGMIQVRDSNLYNYSRLKNHQQDKHTWQSVTGGAQQYWIFEKKLTNINACARCSLQEALHSGILTQDYLCRKCTPAIARRTAYHTAVGI